MRGIPTIAPAAARALGLAFAAVALGACNGPPLAPRSKVTGPRVLAIIAEPPEVAPGQSSVVRVVTGGLSAPATFRWSACATPESTTTFVAQSDFGQAAPNVGCFGDAAAGVLPLSGTGPSTTLTVPANILQQIEALQAVYGTGLSTQTLLQVAQTAGLPITVAVEMTTGTTVLRAIKRVVIAMHADPNQNPPPPHFRFVVSPDGGAGGAHLSYVTGADDLCAPDDGAPLTVARKARVEIAPDADEDSWLQDYTQLDSSGALSTAHEAAFYSWFATDGAFEAERTRAPIRDTIWTAPDHAASVTHWLVVRDGRGGESACRYVVDVQ